MGLCCDKDIHTLPSPLHVPADYKSLPNKLRVPDPKFRSIGHSGLKNLGNTCFVNSVIQCILNTQPLIDYFLSQTYKEHMTEEGSDFSPAMAELIEEKWLQRGRSITPSSLVRLVWSSGFFVPRMQHDAHELLEFLLEKLHTELNRAQFSKRRPLVRAELITETRAADWWGEYLLGNSSIIVDLFVGQLRSTIKCLECGHFKSQFEKFSVLSLPIPGDKASLDLKHCLKEFVKEEILTGLDKWGCPACNKKVYSLKKYDIWKVPPILILQLKRFSYSKGKRSKISDFVEYPIVGLDISKYVTGPQKDLNFYDLYAKIDHKGNMEMGHYYSFARNVYTHDWNQFNDSFVCKVNDSKDLKSKNVYVLFYQKSSTCDFYRQQVDLPELWPHMLKKIAVRRASQYYDEEHETTDQKNVLRFRTTRN